MTLQLIPPSHVGQEWTRGAEKLAASCATSGGEITGEQLKLILSRGERQLWRIGGCEGWVVTRVDQLPNVRTLHICDLYAPRAQWAACFDQLKEMAQAAGCEELRFSAGPAQARLYQRVRDDLEPLYMTMRIKL